MRWAEATGYEADIALQTLPQRRFQIGGIVADNRDARRLEAEAQGLLGEERAVEIGSFAANELAARDDDCDPWTTQEPRGRVSWPLVGTFTLTPATRMITFPGEERVIVSLCGANRLTCPRSSVPR